MKKIFSVLMLLTLIIFATPAQAQADFNFGGKLIHCTGSITWAGRVVDNIDFLALRSGPSVNYPMLTKIPPGTYIEFTTSGSEDGYGENPYFVKVTYNGITGFSHERYIKYLKILR